MADQYTPTTDEIREYVANGGEYRPWVAPDAALDDKRAEAFGRWLAQHDREVAARTLREAADKWTQGEWSNYIPPRGNERPALILGMAQAPGDWLRNRADRIEKGDTGD